MTWLAVRGSRSWPPKTSGYPARVAPKSPLSWIIAVVVLVAIILAAITLESPASVFIVLGVGFAGAALVNYTEKRARR